MESLVILCFLLLSIPLALGQICWKNVSVPYVKWGYQYISRQTSCDYKCWGKWRQSMLDSGYGTSTCQLAFYTESIPECCLGYEKDSRGECKPLCEEGCINGHCSEPNICDCEEGFRAVSNGCIPICDPQCIFGTCSSPGQCSCLTGYKNITANECAPVCDPACENGKCIAPSTCECSYGFYASSKSSHLCEPRCDPELADCGEGTCVGLNRCSCKDGFVFRDHRCVPQCNQTCINGECSEPDTCTCKKGFSKSSTNPNVCEPVCNGGCQNGSCIAPNTCQCFHGYQPSSNDTTSCESSCDQEFINTGNGLCIAPNVLRCNEGFELVFSSLSEFMECIPVDQLTSV